MEKEGINRLLKRPHARSGIIYTAIDLSTQLISGNYFIPIWDGTDHFNFACQKCKSKADVLYVEFNAKYASPPDVQYALFFRLRCPNCGGTGQRKIYLDTKEGTAFCNIMYDTENKRVYVYGKERQPTIVEEHE